MSDSVDTYGDLRVHRLEGGVSEVYFYNTSIACCNRHTTAKRFLDKLANYKANAQISPSIGRVLGYLDYCHDQGIAPTEKHRQKMELMEAMK